MHLADNLIHTSIRIYVIGTVFIILTWFISVLHIDNMTKDALFAMYA